MEYLPVETRYNVLVQILLLVMVALSSASLKMNIKQVSKLSRSPGEGALGYFLGGYVPPGTPNWHPVLNKNSPKIDTPF